MACLEKHKLLISAGAAGSAGLLLWALYKYYKSKKTRHRDSKCEDWYDLVINLDDFMSVCRNGWIVDDRRIDIEQWKGAIVTVLGEFNKGKTWILNKLTGAKLPSGVNIRTEGLSFKRLRVGRKEICLLDTAGAGSPVRSVTTGQLQQKKATEKFLRDVVFECADVFLYIVNDISAEEQIQLHSLALSLEQSMKEDKRVIVIHNLRERATEEDMREACERIVDMFVSSGCYAFSPEEVMDDATGTRKVIDVLSGLKEHRVAKYQTHLFLGKDGTPAGRSNDAVFSKIRQILNTATARQEYQVQEKILQSFSMMLPKYIEGPPMQLCLFPDDNNQHPVKHLTVVPEDKYLPLETRGLLKRMVRICKQERTHSDLKTGQLEVYIPRLLQKCPELAEDFSANLGWAQGSFKRVPSWENAVQFLEQHVAETQPLDSDADHLLQPGESPADLQQRWLKEDVHSPVGKEGALHMGELEAGLFRLKPQPLPYFLSAEQTDGSCPAFTVNETSDSLLFSIELPGVNEPRLSFRPLVAGGGFMFCVVAWKPSPLAQNQILRTHSDSRMMGSCARPLQFSFVVPSVFEMPLPDRQGLLPQVGDFHNGVLTVRFRKLPEVETTLTIASDTKSTPRDTPRTPRTLPPSPCPSLPSTFTSPGLPSTFTSPGSFASGVPL